MTAEKERRYRATVFLSPAQHGKAEKLADARGESLSTFLAKSLAYFLALPVRQMGETRQVHNREGVKATVLLSAHLRTRAKRAAIYEGSTLQELFVCGLELQIGHNGGGKK